MLAPIKTNVYSVPVKRPAAQATPKGQADAAPSTSTAVQKGPGRDVRLDTDALGGEDGENRSRHGPVLVEEILLYEPPQDPVDFRGTIYNFTI